MTSPPPEDVSADPWTIRPARPDDAPVLQEIEVEAGGLFATIGMDRVAADPPFTITELEAYATAGHAWVAVDGLGRPLGYLVAELVDGAAHIEQVSVRPGHGRRGIGGALVDGVAEWAASEGIEALTLTTFRDVPWNGPLYERLGFVRLDERAMTPGLRRIRAIEAAHGLDAWPRIAMIRRLSGAR
jgi:GNAT superfamily N-acetyltransferase